MPDHVHFFAAPAREGAHTLSSFVCRWKTWTSRELKRVEPGSRGWQPEFFDRLLRSVESCDREWEYVRQNAVRAGLARTTAEWPYQGEIMPLVW